MKKIIIISLLLFVFSTCSGPEPNLQLSNPEAFSFDLGDSWEVIASVSAKGFAQEEKEDSFSIHLSYSVDLVTAEADSLISIYSDNVDSNDSEEFIDLPLEAQIEIDSSFAEGSYKLVFNVKDEISNQIKSIEVKFDLTE
jgi:hypothetical protein